MKIDKTQEQWQVIRNKGYALAGTVVTALFILGVIGDVQEGTKFVDLLFSAADNIVALVGLVIAWTKSRPSKTVTLNLPANDVEFVSMTDSRFIAGPASPEKTGTLIS